MPGAALAPAERARQRGRAGQSAAHVRVDHADVQRGHGPIQLVSCARVVSEMSSRVAALWSCRW
jgi:hypothetical protein